MTVNTGKHRDARLRLATLVATVLAPVPLGIALLAYVGWHSSANPYVGAAWGLFAAFFAAGLPFAITHRLRTDRPEGGHSHKRRVAYLAIALVCAATGITIMILFGAPPHVAAATVTMMVGLLVSLLINTRWSISNHTSAAAGGAIMLAIMIGPLALAALVPLTALVAWSRVTLQTHTTSQAIAGVALGSVVAAVIFPALG